MNHKELYQDLKELVDADVGFILTEQQYLGNTYHIFTYRLVSHQDFLRKNALQSRGITFLVDGNDVQIVSWPFEKFFNWHENELTENLDFSNPKEIALKADGSMVSSLMTNNKILLKSKGSLFSDQAVDATSFLMTQSGLKKEVEALEQHGYTTIFEWCAPHNQIVCYYDKPQLITLGVRSRIDGHYLTKKDVQNLGVKEIVNCWTENFDPDEIKPEAIADMENIEGFVFWLNNGQRVKLKTQWYLVRHRVFDIVQSEKAIFESVLNEEIDDIRSTFADDSQIIARIDRIERLAIQAYNKFVETVENFHKENKELSRKDFAIKAKEVLQPLQFSAVMQVYSGKIPNYKEFILKQYKDILNKPA